MNWTGCGREQARCNFKNSPGICWDGLKRVTNFLGKEGNLETET